MARCNSIRSSLCKPTTSTRGEEISKGNETAKSGTEESSRTSVVQRRKRVSGFRMHLDESDVGPLIAASNSIEGEEVRHRPLQELGV